MRNRSRQRGHLTPHEVAELLMVNPVTVRQWAARGLLRALTTPGGHRRFSLSDVEEFARAHGATPVSRNRHRPDRILIVHPDRIGPAEFVRKLRASHPQVLVELAHDAFEAGRCIECFRPHALLLRAEMPGLEPLEVCHRLRARPTFSGLRILVLGGSADERFARALLEAGASAAIADGLDADRVLAELGLAS